MRTSFHHQSEAQPPNGTLTAATSPDTPSYLASQPVRSQWATSAQQEYARRAVFIGSISVWDMGH
jgi:hypothetical protein